MYDKELREPQTNERVMITTSREVVEGTLFYNENVRMSDAVNSLTNQHTRYLSLKDAVVFSIATGREILRASFLMISHHHVIYMVPLAGLQSAAQVEAAQQQQRIEIDPALAVRSENERALPTPRVAPANLDEPMSPRPVSRAEKSAPEPPAPTAADGKPNLVSRQILSRRAMLEVLHTLRSNDPSSDDAGKR